MTRPGRPPVPAREAPARRRGSRADAARLLRIGAVLAARLGGGAASALAARSCAPLAESLCAAFESLGPAFVKLGQFLSVRPDLLSPAALAAFERLQDRAAPVPFEAIRREVEAELGASLESLFEAFEVRPIASASLSQVHRALLPGGIAVAVKVRRPGAAAALRRDLRILGRAFRAAVSLSPLRGRVDAAALWAELLRTAEEELDFRREAETAEALARNFRGVSGIRVPRIHWGWTARRVLTAEFVEGVKISDPSVRARPDYAALAERGARAFLRQVLDHGLFHADLHPANVLVTPGGEVAYVDFGIAGRLSPRERESLLGALAGLLCRDAPLALRHLGRLGVRVPEAAAEPFAAEVGEVLDGALAPTLADTDLQRVGRGILAAVHRHRVGFPRKYALLVKALLTVEGTARTLHPAFSFEPVARDDLAERYRRNATVSGALEALWRGAALAGLAAVTAGEGALRAPAGTQRGPDGPEEESRGRGSDL